MVVGFNYLYCYSAGTTPQPELRGRMDERGFGCMMLALENKMPFAHLQLPDINQMECICVIHTYTHQEKFEIWCDACPTHPLACYQDTFPSRFEENIRPADITPTMTYCWDSVKMHRGSSGHRTCESTESKAMNELWTRQKTTTEQFLLDARMSLQGEYLAARRGLREATRTNVGGTPNVPSIWAEAAVPCLTCCCGLADSD